MKNEHKVLDNFQTIGRLHRKSKYISHNIVPWNFITLEQIIAQKIQKKIDNLKSSEDNSELI